MFTALRDEIDPTIAAISTLMTAASFLLVLIASTRQGRVAHEAATPRPHPEEPPKAASRRMATGLRVPATDLGFTRDRHY